MAAKKVSLLRLAQIFVQNEESSSSDDEALLMCATSVIIQHCQEKKKRNCVPMYCEKTVTALSDAEFRTHFRLCRSTVSEIIVQFGSSEYYHAENPQGGGKPATTPEKSILSFLWFVGHRAPSYRDISDRFDISKSCFSAVLDKVNHFFKRLAKDVISWPSGAQLKIIKEEFQLKHGFPNVSGCIDGTHLGINAPNVDAISYFNRNKYYSVQMQAICDSRKCFTDIFIGFPGSVHDARVFRNSTVYQSLSEKCEGGYILGDSAYPLSSFCLTPFRDNGHLQPAEILYNKLHSATRVVIEHAFGMLKQRFPILKHNAVRRIDVVCDIALSCCFLHNLCVNDDFDLQFEPESVENVTDFTSGNEEACQLRSKIASDLFEKYSC